MEFAGALQRSPNSLWVRSEMAAGRRAELDWIRHGAALAVFVGHARNIVGGPSTLWAHMISGQAVNVFFVVSGALIYPSARRLSTRKFVVHRILRIYPALLCVLLVTSFVFAPIAAALNNVKWEPSSALFYLLRNLLLVPGWQTDISSTLQWSDRSLSWNSPLWTLFFEVVCYGLTLVLVKALRSRPVLASASSISVTTLVHLVSRREDLAFLHTASQLGLAFLIGTVVGQVHSRKLLIFVGTVCLVPVFLGEFFPIWILVLAVVILSLGRRLPFSPPQLPFDISYGVYIWHWPLLQFISCLMTRTHFRDSWALSMLVVSLPLAVLSSLSWVIVEKPSLALARRSKSCSFTHSPTSQGSGRARK